MSKYFLFTSLAANQTEFFKRIAEDLKAQGFGAGVVCYHERSMDLLESSSADAYNIFEIVRNHVQFQSNLSQQFSEIIKKYQYPDSHIIFAHEMAAFNIFSEVQLQKNISDTVKLSVSFLRK